MAVDVQLAKLGPEMESALLTEWLVDDGEAVAEGQAIATIETDKVTTDLEAPAAGVLKRLVPDETECAVGQRVALIAAPGEEISEDAGPMPAPAPSSGEPDAPAEPSVATAGNGASGPVAGKLRASPLARRMAADMGVDLAALASANPGSPLRKRHVIAAADSTPSSTPAEPAAGLDPAPLTAGREPLSPMRRRISQRMVSSLQETAQITDFREHDVTDLVEMRKEGSRWAKRLGLGLSFTDLFVRATVLALEAVPDLNASLDGDDLVRHSDANIGIAVAVPEGLIVPVLHRAQELSVAEIDRRVATLVERARDGSVGLDDLAGGTFTITNIGSYGSHMATPILVQGQVGILGTGALLRRPVARGEEIAIGTTMYTSLTIDHRLVDGKTAGEFQTALGELLRRPEDLL